MRPIPSFSPRAIGIASALVAVVIWTSFIVIARATADPTRGGALNSFDIALARPPGADTILLTLGWLLVRRDRARRQTASSPAGRYVT